MFDISTQSSASASPAHCLSADRGIDRKLSNIVEFPAADIVNAVSALKDRLTERSAILRNDARFSVQGKREQLKDLAQLLEDSANLLTTLEAANRASR